MERTVEDSGVNVNAEQGEGHDPDGVFDDRNGKDPKRQNDFSPPGRKKHMSCENADDKEDQTRPDAAALFRHLDAQARQMECKPLPEYRDTREFEDPVGNLRGADLQQEDDPLHQKTGDRHHEKKEQEREESATGGIKAVEQDKPSDPAENCREGHHGEEVVLIKPRSESSFKQEKPNPSDDQNTSLEYRDIVLLEYFISSGVNQVYAHQRNENDVGIQLVLKGGFQKQFHGAKKQQDGQNQEKKKERVPPLQLPCDHHRIIPCRPKPHGSQSEE